MKPSISARMIFFLVYSLIWATTCLPQCHDNKPFSAKLAQSPVIVTGDIQKISSPLSVDSLTKSFNITFLVKCILKGTRPTDQTITIRHSPPGRHNGCPLRSRDRARMYSAENPICYRTLINEHRYVFFLNQTARRGYYHALPFHELSLNDDSTVEVLKRTCAIQARPFHEVAKGAEGEGPCPIVSIGCA